MKNTNFKTKRSMTVNGGEIAEVYYKGQLVGKVEADSKSYEATVNTSNWQNNRTMESNNPLSVGIEWVKRQVTQANAWLD